MVAKSPKRSGRPRIKPEVRQAAYHLLDFYSPGEASKKLEDDYGSDAPSQRQIERYKRESMPRDASAPWSLSEEADRHGCSLVPPVLVAVIEKSSGRRRHITIEEAKWIIRVRLAAPDLDPWHAWLFSRAYTRRQQQGQSAADLDHFLSFAPWRSDEAAQRYRHAVRQGWVAPPPTLVKSLIRGGIEPGPYVTGPQLERYLESLKEEKEAPNGE